MNMILTIVVAAGSGTRMGGGRPKQFLSLAGEPIVMHTLRRMFEGVEKYLIDCVQNVDNIVEYAQPVDNIVHKLVLILPKEYLKLWDELCDKYDFRTPHVVVSGGDTRFESVKKGLAAVPEADLILVHDGVRPFPNDDVIGGVINAAKVYGAAVPVMPVVESLRRLEGEGSVTVSRAEYRTVQTPQGFQGDLLRRAYGVGYDPMFTDDASVVEALGEVPIRLTQGGDSNIKITTPIDLTVAESMMKV